MRDEKSSITLEIIAFAPLSHMIFAEYGLRVVLRLALKARNFEVVREP